MHHTSLYNLYKGRTFRDADTVVAVQELARQSAITQETEIDKEPEVKFAEIAITVMKEKSACQEIVIQNADVEHLRDAVCLSKS